MPNKKSKLKKTVKIIDDQDRITETEEVGVPTLFQPGDWDIAEEMQNNEALREHLRDSQDDC